MSTLTRRNHEDLNLLSIILNQEIRRLATQVFSFYLLYYYVGVVFLLWMVSSLP